MAKTTKATITIDGVEYVRADAVQPTEVSGDLRIVILQRGWVMVGPHKPVKPKAPHHPGTTPTHNGAHSQAVHMTRKRK